MKHLSWGILLIGLFVLASVAGSRATCLDYDSILPIVGEADESIELIAVDVLGSWAFAIDKTAGSARELVVYSIHDPEAPERIVAVDLISYADKIVCRDSRAYVITWSYGGSLLAVIDIYDPTAPVELGRLALPQKLYDLAVEGDLCAVTSDDDGLLLIDVADPAAMSVIGTFVPPNWQGFTRAVAMDGNRLVLGLDDNNDGYLYLLEVGDPADPWVLGSVLVDRAILGLELVDGGLMVMATSYHSIITLDISDPGAMQVLGVRSSAGMQLVLGGDLALSYWEDNGEALLLDVTDPADPLWLVTKRHFLRGGVRKGAYLVLARGNDGLALARLPATPEGPIAGAEYVHASRGRLFDTPQPDIILDLANENFRLVDLSDPTAPHQRSYRYMDDPFTAAFKGDLAYILGAAMNVLVDLSDPDDPVTITTVELPAETEHLLWYGDRLYASRGISGLTILDATDPAAPVPVGQLETNGSVRRTAPFGAYVLLADNVDGIKVVDVGDPADPQVIGAVSGIMHGQILAVSGDRCFVAGSQLANVVEVDLSDPTAPVIAATTPMPSAPNALLVTDGQLWTAHGGGVTVFDIGDPGGLEMAGELATHSIARGLAPGGGHVATAVGYLLALRPPCSATVAVGEVPAAPRGRLLAVPNPFNPRTTVSFNLDRDRRVTLAVYDLAGRRLATLASGDFAAGAHQISWDGTDAQGRALPSGAYLLRLTGDDLRQSAKVSLVR